MTSSSVDDELSALVIDALRFRLAGVAALSTWSAGVVVVVDGTTLVTAAVKAVDWTEPEIDVTVVLIGGTAGWTAGDWSADMAGPLAASAVVGLDWLADVAAVGALMTSSTGGVVSMAVEVLATAVAGWTVVGWARVGRAMVGRTAGGCAFAVGWRGCLTDVTSSVGGAVSMATGRRRWMKVGELAMRTWRR